MRIEKSLFSWLHISMARAVASLLLICGAAYAQPGGGGNGGAAQQVGMSPAELADAVNNIESGGEGLEAPGPDFSISTGEAELLRANQEALQQNQEALDAVGRSLDNGTFIAVYNINQQILETSRSILENSQSILDSLSPTSGGFEAQPPALDAPGTGATSTGSNAIGMTQPLINQDFSSTGTAMGGGGGGGGGSGGGGSGTPPFQFTGDFFVPTGGGQINLTNAPIFTSLSAPFGDLGTGTSITVVGFGVPVTQTPAGLVDGNNPGVTLQVLDPGNVQRAGNQVFSNNGTVSFNGGPGLPNALILVE